jgi:hypothetical protein
MKRKKKAQKKPASAGYEAICPSSIEALRALNRTKSTEEVYQAIAAAGSRGLTRHELLSAMGKEGVAWASITARVGELRSQGWVRHKTTQKAGKRVLVRRADPTGRDNTVIVAVPHFEEMFTHSAFVAERDELRDALEEQEAMLKKAADAKQWALDVLRRIHRKLRLCL